MILSLINSKGGVGKTTTAINLGAGLASSGRRVLLVDLDSQSSASLSLGFKREELNPSMADVLLEGMDIMEAARETSTKGLSLVTGSKNLANADIRLANESDRVHRLKACLEPARDKFDFIVIDCPPSLGLTTVNGLVGSDYFLVPLNPEYLALEGLVDLLDSVEMIRDGVGRVAEMLGIVLVKVDRRLGITGELTTMVRGHYKGLVFGTEIPINVRLTEAPSHGKTIFQYDKGCRGGEGYRRLAAEFLRRTAGTEEVSDGHQA